VQKRHDPEDYYHPFYMDDEIENSPVHSRAWVLQERCMAPRIFHFGKKTIFWECRQSIARPGKTIPNISLLGYSTQNPALPSAQKVRDFLRIWARIVNRYTTTSLTFLSDKFIAISALARELHRVLKVDIDPSVAYLSGLWTLFLENQQLWSSKSPETTTRLSETGGLAAPSWSWASLNGPVDALFLSETTKGQ
jgi:hypothetical protein